MKNTIRFLHLQGKEIIPYLPDLMQLRLKIFKEYPYLYEGHSQDEENYIKKFINQERAIFLLALSDKKVVGVATALPLEFESEAIKKPFLEHRFDISKMFYLGEQILLPEYRGQGFGGRFFIECERLIKNFEQYAIITFCAIKRSENDPRRPAEYRALDNYFKRQGYEKHPELIAELNWTEIGDKEKSPHLLVFWLKKI